jgi:predicted transcriptional regulator
MQPESKQVPVRVERIVALFALDRPAGCSRTELVGELHDIDPEAVSAAVSGLEAVGVVTVEGEQVRASECLKHLDVLNLISA